MTALRQEAINILENIPDQNLLITLLPKERESIALPGLKIKHFILEQDIFPIMP